MRSRKVNFEHWGTLHLDIDRNSIPGNLRWQLPSQASCTPYITLIIFLEFDTIIIITQVELR